jgi:hypothetical protein
LFKSLKWFKGLMLGIAIATGIDIAIEIEIHFFMHHLNN